MPTGFEIKGDSLRTQFNSDDTQMALAFKQTYSSLPVGLHTVAVSGRTAPLIAWTSSDHVALTGCTISGSTWTYELRVKTAGTNLTVYVFDFTRFAITPSTYGAQAYDAAGNLLFDAVGGKYMKVMGLIAETGVSFTVPAGKVYATGVGIPGAHWYGGAFPNGAFQYPTTKTTGGSITTSTLSITSGGIGLNVHVWGTFLIIDVTNY